MTRREIWALAAIAIALSATAPRSAAAKPTKSQCIDANTAGQSLRLSGKLTEARKELTLCSDPACPAIVRSDCVQRVDELARIQPTLVLGVKDRSGADVTAVNVTIDGKPFTERLDGAALPVDPGSHVFVITVRGEPPVSRTLVIREGEKGRIEQVSLAPKAPPPSEAAPPGEPSGLGAQKILGIAAGALGVVGVGVGSIFGSLAISAADQQKVNCASASICADHAQALDDHASAVTMGTASTAAFVAGGALLVTGSILFFTARSPRREAALQVAPAASPSSGGLWVSGRF